MNEAGVARRLAALPCLGAILSLVLLSIVAFSACSSPTPNLYTLYPHAGAKRGSRALRVELRRPRVPAYLDRSQIVRRVGPGRLELAGNDWWGSPLEEMVGTTVAMNLSERLPNSTVYTEAGTISTQPDVVVELQIQRFEPNYRGSVELLAQVSLHVPGAPKAAVITRHELTGRVEDDSAAVAVNVMSRLLAELSDEIAQSIAQRAPPPRARAAKEGPLDGAHVWPTVDRPAPRGRMGGASARVALGVVAPDSDRLVQDRVTAAAGENLLQNPLGGGLVSRTFHRPDEVEKPRAGGDELADASARVAYHLHVGEPPSVAGKLAGQAPRCRQAPLPRLAARPAARALKAKEGAVYGIEEAADFLGEDRAETRRSPWHPKLSRRDAR